MTNLALTRIDGRTVQLTIDIDELAWVTAFAMRALNMPNSNANKNNEPAKRRALLQKLTDLRVNLS